MLIYKITCSGEGGKYTCGNVSVNNLPTLVAVSLSHFLVRFTCSALLSAELLLTSEVVSSVVSAVIPLASDFGVLKGFEHRSNRSCALSHILYRMIYRYTLLNLGGF